MSEIQDSTFSDSSSQDDYLTSSSFKSSEGQRLQLKPILGVFAAEGQEVLFPSESADIAELESLLSDISHQELSNPELKKDSKYSTELDEIFMQLRETDDHIAKTHQNTVRLGTETRSMLDDLRKQLG